MYQTVHLIYVHSLSRQIEAKSIYINIVSGLQICDELQLRLAAGQVRLKPAIRCFGTQSVTFVDGSTVRADVVVLATGFRYAFDYLEEGRLVPVKEGQVRLWKNMIPVQLAGQAPRCSLAVVGMLQVSGSGILDK